MNVLRSRNVLRQSLQGSEGSVPPQNLAVHLVDHTCKPRESRIDIGGVACGVKILVQLDLLQVGCIQISVYEVEQHIEVGVHLISNCGGVPKECMRLVNESHLTSAPSQGIQESGTIAIRRCLSSEALARSSVL